VKCITIKCFRKTAQNHHDLDLGDEFIETVLKAQTPKEKK
jgi:hypothetical protein